MHVGYVLHSPSRKESWATAGQAIVAASMMVRIIGFLALFYRSLITQFLELYDGNAASQPTHVKP